MEIRQIDSTRPIHFIVNPYALSGQNVAMEAWLKERLAGTIHTVKITATVKDVVNEVDYAVSRGAAGIVAVGGDGTASHLLRGLYQRGLPLPMGVINSGSGNDIRRGLGLPKHYNEALARILHGRVRLLDIGVANGVPFLNSASFGFDAYVVKVMEEIRKTFPGKWPYRLAVLQSLFRYQAVPVSITCGEAVYEKSLLLFAVANGPYYGGGFSVCPMAVMDDGQLHSCMIWEGKGKRRLGLLLDVVRHVHLDNEKQVKLFTENEYTVTPHAPVWMNLDGELSSVTEAVNIRLEAGKLAFID